MLLGGIKTKIKDQGKKQKKVAFTSYKIKQFKSDKSKTCEPLVDQNLDQIFFEKKSKIYFY